MKHHTTTLTPAEEIAYMRDVLKIEDPAQMLDRVVNHFLILQTRSGLLLSLITICLTISGFSGHRIAATGPLPAVLLALGLFLAVVSAILLFRGPLQLRWATQHARKGELDQTLEELISLRNLRTRRYVCAGWVLIAGLTCYVLSVMLFVLIEGFQL